MITPMLKQLLLPATVLMLITFIVWLNMLLRRIIFVKKSKLNIQAYRTPEAFNQVLDERVQAPANCYRNLLEVPLIFYVLTIFVAITSSGDALFINMAWAFVGLRALQACVHCTYNRVMHRFYAYLGSSLILCIMTVRFFLSLF